MNWRDYPYWFCPRHGCLGAHNDPDCRTRHSHRTACPEQPLLFTFRQWRFYLQLRRQPPRPHPITGHRLPST